MKNPVFRTAIRYAVLAGGFILLDLTLDRLIGGSPGLDLPHFILAAIVVLSSFVLLSRALEARNRAEATLRQARDELDIRVQERTAELVRANAALQAEIAERKRVEQALQESEETLQALMNASPESAVLFDTQGLMLAANETAAQRLGVTVDRMMGSSVFDFFSWQVADRRRDYLDQVLRTGRPAFFEDERDGRLFDIYAHPVCDADGKTIKIAVFGHDVTERKQAGETLRVANERLEMAQRAAGAGIWDWDITTGHIEWSPQMFELFGLDPQKATASFETWEAVLHPEDKESASARIDQALKEHTLLVNEYRIGRPDGQIRWINALGQGAYDDQGRAVRMAGICIDITERKRAEETMAWLASFPQVNPNPILEVDASGAVTFCNSATTATLRKLGIKDNARAFLPGDLAAILQELEQKRETQFYREVQLGGAIFGERVYLAPAFNAVRIYTHDITESKRAEEEMRQAFEESRQRQAEVSALLAGSRAVLEYREFKDAARAIFDAGKNLLGATGGYVSLLSKDGTRNEPLLLDPGNLPCTVDPALPMPIRGLREQVYRTRQAVYDNDFSSSEWTQLLPDGHVCLDNVLFAPLAIQGIVVGLIGLANKPGGFTDNDARLASAFGELAAIALSNRRTRVMLENSEERFRSVAQSANYAIITLNSQENIVFWNRAAETIFGYPAAEMMGKPFTCIIPRQVSEAREDQVRRALATGQSALIGKTIEATGLRKDGGECPIELSFANWETKEGIFFTSTIRDITERKQSEAALRQTQEELARRIQERTTLEERQRLARELHDSVSQALYGISLGTHTALTLLDTDRAKVLEALNYVLSLTQAGLTEMRSLIFELRPESLAIEGLVVALGKHAAALRARHGIEVELALCDEPDAPLPVKEAIYRIAQEALQNAVKHSRSERLDVRLRCGEESIDLEVCDNGVGFDPQAPYPGHLGLRSMRERASSVGGVLEIESIPGCGTRIRANVPIRAVELAPSP